MTLTVFPETTVTSSQNKTSTLFWMAPEKGGLQVGKTVVETAMTRLRTTNSYPRPNEALVAYASRLSLVKLHGNDGGNLLAWQHSLDRELAGRGEGQP